MLYYGVLTYLSGAGLYALWILYCHLINGGVRGMLRDSKGLWHGEAIYRSRSGRRTYQIAAFCSAVWMIALWPRYVWLMVFGR